MYGIQLCLFWTKAFILQLTMYVVLFDMAAVGTIFSFAEVWVRDSYLQICHIFCYKHLCVRDWLNKLFLSFILNLVWINLNIIIHLQYKGVDRWLKILKIYIFFSAFSGIYWKVRCNENFRFKTLLILHAQDLILILHNRID